MLSARIVKPHMRRITANINIAQNVAQEWTEAKAMTNAEKFLAEILPELIPYELKCNLHSLRCPGEECNGECFDCFNRSIIWLQEEVEGESE